MKAKALSCRYTDGSEYETVRVYLETDFDQAGRDYLMMCKYASDCRTWKLENIEVFNCSRVHESQREQFIAFAKFAKSYRSSRNLEVAYDSWVLDKESK